MMQRLTARLLLLLVVVSGNFEPLMEAISVPNAHACCLRKLYAAKNSPLQITDATAPHGNCCPPMTTQQSAQTAGCEVISALVSVSNLEAWSTELGHNVELVSTLSARAPPFLS
jgi:hypothetical protein